MCSTGSLGRHSDRVQYAATQGFDKIITMDADGQHLPTMLNRLLESHAKSNANVVVGSAPSRVHSSNYLLGGF